MWIRLDGDGAIHSQHLQRSVTLLALRYDRQELFTLMTSCIEKHILHSPSQELEENTCSERRDKSNIQLKRPYHTINPFTLTILRKIRVA